MEPIFSNEHKALWPDLKFDWHMGKGVCTDLKDQMAIKYFSSCP